MSERESERERKNDWKSVRNNDIVAARKCTCRSGGLLVLETRFRLNVMVDCIYYNNSLFQRKQSNTTLNNVSSSLKKHTLNPRYRKQNEYTV